MKSDMIFLYMLKKMTQFSFYETIFVKVLVSANFFLNFTLPNSPLLYSSVSTGIIFSALLVKHVFVPGSYKCSDIPHYVLLVNVMFSFTLASLSAVMKKRFKVFQKFGKVDQIMRIFTVEGNVKSTPIHHQFIQREKKIMVSVFLSFFWKQVIPFFCGCQSFYFYFKTKL